MADSAIEWTDKTWNPTVGCSKVSAGCKNCYAETMHARLTGMRAPKYAEPFTVVKPWPEHLAEPLRWKKPSRIFVNSMSDLFHEDVSDEYIAAVFGVMAACPQHTFQVLTKRAERMARWMLSEKMPDLCNSACRYLDSIGFERGCGSAFDPSNWPLPNVWPGVSVENQEQADARIPYLLSVPAAVRFLSCEPLLGPLNLFQATPERPGAGDRVCEFSARNTPFADYVNWVIVGGESGIGSRPFQFEWARSIVQQCKDAGVACFVKQVGANPHGEWGPGDPPMHYVYDITVDPPEDRHELRRCKNGRWKLTSKKGNDISEFPIDLQVREFPRVG